MCIMEGGIHSRRLCSNSRYKSDFLFLLSLINTDAALHSIRSGIVKGIIRLKIEMNNLLALISLQSVWL